MGEANGPIGGQGQQSCYADRIAKVTALYCFAQAFDLHATQRFISYVSGFSLSKAQSF